MDYAKVLPINLGVVATLRFLKGNSHMTTNKSKRYQALIRKFWGVIPPMGFASAFELHRTALKYQRVQAGFSGDYEGSRDCWLKWISHTVLPNYEGFSSTELANMRKFWSEHANDRAKKLVLEYSFELPVKVLARLSGLTSQTVRKIQKECLNPVPTRGELQKIWNRFAASGDQLTLRLLDHSEVEVLLEEFEAANATLKAEDDQRQKDRRQTHQQHLTAQHSALAEHGSGDRPCSGVCGVSWPRVDICYSRSSRTGELVAECRACVYLRGIRSYDVKRKTAGQEKGRVLRGKEDKRFRQVCKRYSYCIPPAILREAFGASQWYHAKVRKGEKIFVPANYSAGLSLWWVLLEDLPNFQNLTEAEVSKIRELWIKHKESKLAEWAEDDRQLSEMLWNDKTRLKGKIKKICDGCKKKFSADNDKFFPRKRMGQLYSRCRACQNGKIRQKNHRAWLRKFEVKLMEMRKKKRIKEDLF